MEATLLHTSSASTAASSLDSLRNVTRIVADTSDFATLQEYAPQDATTNPSLILKAAQKPQYRHLLEQAVAEHTGASLPKDALVGDIADTLLVLFGVEILKLIPGRVSTETDASLCFDIPGLIGKAQKFIHLYEKRGIPRERVLIKLASTWEGIRAARVLQTQRIHCNMTLLFCLTQARACADAGATLISPFVGRILDWHKAKTGKDFTPSEDPGVISVRNIYSYYKRNGIPTEIMGASFRNVGEILELAGCDLLTISPQLLDELKRLTTPVERKLTPRMAAEGALVDCELDERKFRWLLNEDAMATEKLTEGIRLFHADALKLAHLIEAQL